MRLCVGSLAALVLLLAGLAVDYSQHAQSSEEAKSTGNHQQPDESLWAPTTWAPITVFTAALFLVGGTQAAFFVWQLGYIKSADETARRAANAAVLNAQAAANGADLTRKVETPNLILVSARDGNPGSLVRTFEEFIPEIVFLNVGARPAIVTGHCIDVRIGEFMPPELFRISRHYALPHPEIVQHMTTCEVSRSGYSDKAFWRMNIGKVLKGHLALWVWGYIEFKGFDDNPVRQRFRYNVVPIGPDENTSEGYLFWRSVPFENEKADQTAKWGSP